MTPIKIAVVGLGYWGPNLARIFAETPGCTLSALVDSRSEQLSRAGRLHPQAKVFADLDDALKTDIDAVVLATPAQTHATLGRKVLASGRDLFVEKPLALSADDANALADESYSRNRILMVGHLLLYHPAYQEAVRRLRAGEFGALRYMHGRRVNLGIVRSNENALWSLAPHDIAVSNWIAGSAPVAVAAVGTSYLQKDIEDVVFYTLRYPSTTGNVPCHAGSGDRKAGRSRPLDSGPCVIFHGHVSWLDPQKVRELSIIGTEKMAVIDDVTASEKLRIFEATVETQRQSFTSYGQFLSIRTGDVLMPHLSSAEPLKQEAAAFIECVRERTSPLSDAASGVNVVRTLERLTQSLRDNGGWKEL